MRDCINERDYQIKGNRHDKRILGSLGVSSILLAILFMGYELFRLRHLEDLEASTEVLLYSVTLLFWIIVVGSLVLIWSKKRSQFLSILIVLLNPLVSLGGLLTDQLFLRDHPALDVFSSNGT